MKRTAEQRAELAAHKRAAPISLPSKGERINMQELPLAPPAPRVREAKGMRNGLNTYTRLGVNAERQAANRIHTHGVAHSKWVASLPCCACMPEHYHGPDLKPFLLNADNLSRPISDPHHVRTRGAGGDASDCVPLCRMHHSLLDSGGWGPLTFEETFGIDLRRVAALLWAHSPMFAAEDDAQG